MITSSQVVPPFWKHIHYQALWKSVKILCASGLQNYWSKECGLEPPGVRSTKNLDPYLWNLWQLVFWLFSFMTAFFAKIYKKMSITTQLGQHWCSSNNFHKKHNARFFHATKLHELYQKNILLCCFESQVTRDGFD